MNSKFSFILVISLLTTFASFSMDSNPEEIPMDLEDQYDFTTSGCFTIPANLLESGCFTVPANLLESGVWDLPCSGAWDPTVSGTFPIIGNPGNDVTPPNNILPNFMPMAYAPNLLPPFDKPAETGPYVCDATCRSRAFCEYKPHALQSVIDSGKSHLNTIPADLIKNIKYYIVHPQRCGQKCSLESNDQAFCRYNNNSLCTSKKFTCEHHFQERQAQLLELAIGAGDGNSNLLQIIPANVKPQIKAHLGAQSLQLFQLAENNLLNKIPAELAPKIKVYVPQYKCNVIGCERLFYRHSAFKEHNKIHPKGLPFICSERSGYRSCNEEFPTMDELKSHLELVHGGTFDLTH